MDEEGQSKRVEGTEKGNRRKVGKKMTQERRSQQGRKEALNIVG